MTTHPLLCKALAETLAEGMRGVKQDAWAKACKVTPKSISDYLNEVSFPEFKNFSKMGKEIFKESPEDFLRRIIRKLYEISSRDLIVDDAGRIVVRVASAADTTHPPPSEVREPGLDPDRWAAGEYGSEHPQAAVRVACRQIAEGIVAIGDALAAALGPLTEAPGNGDRSDDGSRDR